jgi:hypothetical protein
VIASFHISGDGHVVAYSLIASQSFVWIADAKTGAILGHIYELYSVVDVPVLLAMTQRPVTRDTMLCVFLAQRRVRRRVDHLDDQQHTTDSHWRVYTICCCCFDLEQATTTRSNHDHHCAPCYTTSDLSTDRGSAGQCAVATRSAVLDRRDDP